MEQLEKMESEGQPEERSQQEVLEGRVFLELMEVLTKGELALLEEEEAIMAEEVVEIVGHTDRLEAVVQVM